MLVSILTLFPQMFAGPFQLSIVKRAIQNNFLAINLINIRDFSTDKYKSVDDHPYGGGVGMILRVDIIDQCLNHTIVNSHISKDKTKIILTDPRGVVYKQKVAVDLSHFDHIIIICGHYEGVDERIRNLVDMEISIGDYVITGGEIAAMVITDSITRLLPGVLKNSAATQNESFSNPNLLEYPQYTKPPVYKKEKVPEVLTSGNHQKIKTWQANQSVYITQKYRADLRKKTK
jgi:tRNA (guanine37-N1)-methyltransferase